ncbi:hypothetical protein HDU77_001578 [Chytriomyces hyalinus]|nr:hypothetical protein HDU77_001578 [Chytriomyces hyalinus]
MPSNNAATQNAQHIRSIKKPGHHLHSQLLPAVKIQIAKPSLWVRGSDFSFLFDDDTETSSSPTIGSFSSAFESPTLESGLNQSMLSPHGTDKDYQNDCFYRTPAQVPNPQSVNADESYLLDHHFEKKQPRNALPLAPYGDKYARQVDGFRAQSQARVSPCEPVIVNQSFSSEMHKNPPTQTSYQTCKKKEMSLGSSGELHWSPLRCQTGLSLINTSRCDSSDRHQQDSGICFDSELNGTGFGFMNAELLGSNLGKFEWRSDQKSYNELPVTPNSSGPHSTDGEQVFFPDSPWNQYSELNSANLRQDTPLTNNDSASWKYYRENRLYSSVAKSPEAILSPVQDSMKPPRLNCRVDTEATGQISPVTPSGREWPVQKKAHEQWRRTVSEKSHLHLQDSTYPPLTAERSKLSNPAMPTTKLAAIPESSQASSDGDTMYCETSFNLRSIALGKDKRTAVMLKNVPNRYTQDMLLEFVNETHKGTYDFFYLRMDFVNNCNVGYAFIKYCLIPPGSDGDSTIMTVLDIRKFFANSIMALKKRPKFNSSKLPLVVPAKIKTKAQFIEQFRNSPIMLEAEAFRPRLFHSSGPMRGCEMQFPGPVGAGIRRKSDVLFSRVV